ncbi:transmembrane protein 242-like isoform X2 [Daphnia pulex]|uniref:transmembrane protein 242-like isoform X2 n=1 Tax=Daphnia pulex TaxID=6669 RepID=UPI001EDCE56B|nr:transmembrane protein 242-like isoform X2 [Daphnia pulex]
MSKDETNQDQMIYSDKASSAQKEKDEKAFKFKAAAFLAGVTGVSILFGFGTTLAAAKKKDPHFFDQGLTGRIEKPTTEPISSETATAVRRRVPVSISSVEPGASLAIRALGWGTLYAVTGCSVLFYGIWKLMAVNDLKEFRLKVGTWLPAVPRNNPPQGRTEFSGLNDLLQYIIDVDKEKKEASNRNDTKLDTVDGYKHSD